MKKRGLPYYSLAHGLSGWLAFQPILLLMNELQYTTHTEYESNSHNHYREIMMQLSNCIFRERYTKLVRQELIFLGLRAFERPTSQASSKRHFNIYATAYPYNSRHVCECKGTKNLIFLLSHSPKSAILHIFNY